MPGKRLQWVIAYDNAPDVNSLAGNGYVDFVEVVSTSWLWRSFELLIPTYLGRKALRKTDKEPTGKRQAAFATYELQVAERKTSC